MHIFKRPCSDFFCIARTCFTLKSKCTHANKYECVERERGREKKRERPCPPPSRTPPPSLLLLFFLARSRYLSFPLSFFLALSRSLPFSLSLFFPSLSLSPSLSHPPSHRNVIPNRHDLQHHTNSISGISLSLCLFLSLSHTHTHSSSLTQK